jgi:hypothetical protein
MVITFVFFVFFQTNSNLFSGLYLSLVDKVKAALREYGVNAGTLTEERVSAILKEFYVKIDEQLIKLDSGNIGNKNVNIVQERVETSSGYMLAFTTEYPMIGAFLVVVHMIFGVSGGLAIRKEKSIR